MKFFGVFTKQRKRWLQPTNLNCWVGRWLFTWMFPGIWKSMVSNPHTLGPVVPLPGAGGPSPPEWRLTFSVGILINLHVPLLPTYNTLFFSVSSDPGDHVVTNKKNRKISLWCALPERAFWPPQNINGNMVWAPQILVVGGFMSGYTHLQPSRDFTGVISNSQLSWGPTCISPLHNNDPRQVISKKIL